MESTLFSSMCHFLSGLYNSLLEQKYFLPILKCKDLQIVKIHPDTPQETADG